MKHYESKEGICAECGKPTQVQVINEAFAQRNLYAAVSVCCESPVMDWETCKEIEMNDLEEAKYEG